MDIIETIECDVEADTINDYLPEELLLKVFEYLDQKDVLSATLVCTT